MPDGQHKHRQVQGGRREDTVMEQRLTQRAVIGITMGRNAMMDMVMRDRSVVLNRCGRARVLEPRQMNVRLDEQALNEERKDTQEQRRRVDAARAPRKCPATNGPGSFRHPDLHDHLRTDLAVSSLSNVSSPHQRARRTPLERELHAFWAYSRFTGRAPVGTRKTGFNKPSKIRHPRRPGWLIARCGECEYALQKRGSALGAA